MTIRCSPPRGCLLGLVLAGLLVAPPTAQAQEAFPDALDDLELAPPVEPVAPAVSPPSPAAVAPPSAPRSASSAPRSASSAPRSASSAPRSAPVPAPTRTHPACQDHASPTPGERALAWLPTGTALVAALVPALATLGIVGLTAGVAWVYRPSTADENGRRANLPTDVRRTLLAVAAAPGLVLLVLTFFAAPGLMSVVTLLAAATLDHVAWLGTWGREARDSGKVIPWVVGGVLAPLLGMASVLPVAAAHAVVGALVWARHDVMSPFRGGLPPNERLWRFWTRNPLHRTKSAADAAVFYSVLATPAVVPCLVGALGLGWGASILGRLGSHHVLDLLLPGPAPEQGCPVASKAGVSP